MCYSKYLILFYFTVACWSLSSCKSPQNSPQIQYELFNSSDCFFDDTYEGLVKKMGNPDNVYLQYYHAYYDGDSSILDSCIVLNYSNEGLKYAKIGDSIHLLFIIIDGNKPYHITYEGKELNETFSMDGACSVFHVSDTCFYKINDIYGMCGLDDNGFGLSLKENNQADVNFYTFYFGADKMLKAIAFPIQTKR